MAGTGNSTPQAGDAGVIPVPQAGEMPEASVYRPPHKLSPLKVAFGGDARHKPNSDAESDIEEDQEELVKDEEVPPEVEDLEAEYDAESVHIDGDEYVMVDVYDNEYYTHEDDEEHLFALTEYQGDTRVQMQRVTLQKAADKLHRPQYTPQEKECL
ncbi:hypothetical protein C0995_010652, partial [Termitomyces sp. Mi166